MWDWSAVAVLLVVAAALIAISAWSVWRRRRLPAAKSLVLVIVAAAWWCFAYALELSAPDLPAVRRWGDLKYVGIVLLPPAWLIFTLRYTDRGDVVTPRRLGWLAVMPLLTLALLANDATHDLLRSYPAFTPGQPPSAAVGPLFWVHFIYTYVLLLIGAVLLLATFLGLSRAYRKQSVVLAVAVVIPLVGNVLYNFRVGPFELIDPTPFAFLLTDAVLVWGVFRFGLLDLVPVARDAIVERMSDGMIVLDAHRRVVDLNPAAEAILGRDATTATGQPLGRLAPRFDALLDERGDIDASQEEVRVERGTSARDYDLALSALRDQRGRPSGHLLVLRDITERKATEERLHRLAHFDPLTSLPNRELFFDRLAAAMTRAQRHQEGLAVLFCDLDRFKRVNDTLGHETGDAVLRHVSQRLAQRLCAEDTIARLGGDEFVVLLPGVDDAEAAAGVARALLEALTAPVVAGGQELYLTMSVGIGVYPRDAEDGPTLLRHADGAMYRAKTRGRHRFEFHAGGTEGRALQRLQLERDLRGARSRGELEVWYQPSVALPSGRIVGMEALLRWRHPRHGLLSPVHFVPLAEETDLIHVLGMWVLAESCRQAVSWRRAGGPNPVTVSVNCSARQFERTELVTEVTDALRESGLEPDCLALEVTESTVMSDTASAVTILRDVQRLGVKIAVDDFGTGYTSLRQLKHYPLHIVKIDRSFVRGLGREPEDRVIVSAMIHLAHDLGLEVVGEGVETVGQRDLLASLGCDVGQGFLFARPLPPAEARALLR